MERLFAERGGRASLDVVSQLRVEDYATASIQLGKVTRRLETLGAVSEAGNKRRSLVDTYSTFSARVERLAAELPPPIVAVMRTTTLSGVEQMPMTALKLAAGLLERLKAGEVLSDVEQGQLVVLEAAIRGEVLLRGPLVDGDPPAVSFGGGDASSSPIVTLDSAPERPPLDEPTPVETCPYCHQAHAACIAMKTSHVLGWRALHHDSPDEIERRRVEATAVMMRPGAGRLPDWYTR